MISPNNSIRCQFHKLFCALRPTFEELFRGVGRALRCVPNFNRAISMICAVGPTFMKSAPEWGRKQIVWEVEAEGSNFESIYNRPQKVVKKILSLGRPTLKKISFHDLHISHLALANYFPSLSFLTFISDVLSIISRRQSTPNLTCYLHNKLH